MVSVHEEKCPRQMRKLGRTIDLIYGISANIRSAVVRVYSNGRTLDIRRQIKLLYPVELTEDIKEQSTDALGPRITSNRDENVVEFIS